MNTKEEAVLDKSEPLRCELGRQRVMLNLSLVKERMEVPSTAPPNSSKEQGQRER